MNDMSQSTITDYISTEKKNMADDNSENSVEMTQDTVFDSRISRITKYGNAPKRLHSCISSDSDHSLCIENELDTIKNSLERIVKKEDIEGIVTQIIGNLTTQMKKEVKKEIMTEVKKENTKMREEYNSKMSLIGRKMEALEFDNHNLLEKNAELHKDLRELKSGIQDISRRADEGVRQGNWNEQYSRKKKNVKIYNYPEKCGEKLPLTFLQDLKDKAKVEIHESEIVAMHRIPGKPEGPRPILIKFLRMESKINLLRKKREIKEVFGDLRIGDDITKLNQGLLNRLYMNEQITSAWFFNGHIYGTDEEGKRYRFDIYDSVEQRLGK